MTTPPTLDRPRFHVWMTPEGQDPNATEPEYVGEVTILNQDQLTAETQGRANGVPDAKAAPFHLTNLWIWAAMVRLDLTRDKFPVFVRRMEYRPVEADTAPEDLEADDLDPTTTAGAPSTP